MKGKFLFFILFCPIFSFAQTINELDTKRRFKEFKLGDKFSKWQDKIQFQSSIAEAKVYKYLGEKDTLFNSFPIDFIELIFYKSKLVSIALTLEKWKGPYNPGQIPDDQAVIEYCNKKIQELSNRFEVMFGEPIIGSLFWTLDNNNRQWSAQRLWIAKKTTLNIHLAFLEQRSNSGTMVVSISNTNFSFRGRTQSYK